MPGVVFVEEVSGRPAYKRFFEFPYLQFLSEPRWSPPLVAHERKRLDPHHRFFDEGDGEFFLARRGGKAVGRITAHVAVKGDEHGWFGFFEADDDPAVAAALVEQAATWLRAQGCTMMTGPASYTVDDDVGVLIDGFDVAGTTGRPWQPPWYAEHLEAAGLHRVPNTEHHTWRLPLTEPPSELGVGGVAIAPLATPTSTGVAGKFADPRIVLPGIVAVPDLTPARNSAITLARRAKRNEWEGCTIVEIDGDPAVLVPTLVPAAAAAGYEWVISPWSSDNDAAPETRHARYELGL